MTTILIPGGLARAGWVLPALPNIQKRIDRASASKRSMSGQTTFGNGTQTVLHHLAHEAWLGEKLGISAVEVASTFDLNQKHRQAPQFRRAVAGQNTWFAAWVGLNLGTDHLVLAHQNERWFGRNSEPEPDLNVGDPLCQAALINLTKTVHECFQEHGFDLIHLDASGCLFANQDPAIAFEVQTSTVLAASGRNIDTYLPRGADARRWRRFVTEVEMVLFQDPMNELRDRLRLPRISSLWLAGTINQGSTWPRDLQLYQGALFPWLASDAEGWQHALQTFDAQFANRSDESLSQIVFTGEYSVSEFNFFAPTLFSRIQKLWKKTELKEFLNIESVAAK
jgi:hypothetical protein